MTMGNAVLLIVVKIVMSMIIDSSIEDVIVRALFPLMKSKGL
jgi:hypothetical protein